MGVLANEGLLVLLTLTAIVIMTHTNCLIYICIPWNDRHFLDVEGYLEVLQPPVASQVEMCQR